MLNGAHAALAEPFRGLGFSRANGPHLSPLGGRTVLSRGAYAGTAQFRAPCDRERLLARAVG
jgi:hypothetical protein